MAEKKTCELCRKSKSLKNMTEYYSAKVQNSQRVMYKCKNCSEEQAEE